MLAVLQILAPVVLVILLGWLLARTGFISSPAVGELNRLTYWVGLPALLIDRIGGATPAFGSVGGILAVMMGTTFILITVSALVGVIARLPARSRVTFVHGTFRGNLAFVGLPVVIYSVAGTESAGSVESAALIAFVPLVILYNVMAVVLLQLPGQSHPITASKRVLRGLASNPILIASLIGILIALSGWEFPVFLDRTLSAVGQMALPLALIGIGAGLHATRLRGQRRWAVTGALMKTALAPLVGFGLAVWIGLGSEEIRLALIFLACPTAAASYVLVQRMDGDSALAAGTIVLSHLFALPAMLVVLALSG
ncbi:AEC family transporter [Spiribacter insolitus]|uniref:AEC family transporter n=1 Tax=Spiribacter insolitus TaxID=3122417 RepID=A0ABV3T5X6_9GAMM